MFIFTDLHNMPAPAPAPAPTPTPTPLDDYNNTSNDINNIPINEDRSGLAHSRNNIFSVLHLNSITNKARPRFFWYVSES